MSRRAMIDEFHFHLLNGAQQEGYSISGWSSRESQERRFDALIRSSGFQAGSIVDYGSGTGDLFGFLRDRGFKFEYSGVDHNARMVDFAIKRYGPYFCGPGALQRDDSRHNSNPCASAHHAADRLQAAQPHPVVKIFTNFPCMEGQVFLQRTVLRQAYEG